MQRLRAFGMFWWDFVIGDDYRVAAGIVLVLGLSAVLSHRGITSWWLPLLAVPALLATSVVTAARTAIRTRDPAAASDS